MIFLRIPFIILIGYLFIGAIITKKPDKNVRSSSATVKNYPGNVSSKAGKVIKARSVQTKSMDLRTFNNILNGINYSLLNKKVGYKNKLNKISTNSNQNISLSKFNKVYNLPSFQSLKNGIKKIEWDNNFSTPRFIELKSKPSTSKPNQVASKASSINTAMNFLINEKSLLKINNPQSEFSLTSVSTDNIGMTHIRYKQVYKDIEIWGKDICLHLKGNGEVLSFNGNFVPTLSIITRINTKLTGENAIEIVNKKLQINPELNQLSEDMKKLLKYSGPLVKKVIWFDNMQIPHLVWLVEIRPSLIQDLYYFVDANNGNILNSYNNVCNNGPTTGNGIDLNGITLTFGTYQVDTVYYLIDASEPMYNSVQSQIPQNPVGAIVGLDLRNQDFSAQNTCYFSLSKNNQWSDPASISANYNAAQTYNYYYQTFNRNSIDDSGMTIYSIIHVTKDGQSMENAYWNGLFMCYGDGGQYTKPLAGGLDVAAHEMTHGVTQYTANLVYQNQSGALNESFSDVFGVLVDSVNWTIGETIVKDFNRYPTGAVRDLENPHNGVNQGSPGWQPIKMSEYVNTTGDNGGVHVNSGIPNHAFYIIASSIGRHKAGAIWYRALTNYLTRSAQFIDARIATEQAAIDLYGDSAPEVNSVKSGWDNVEVYEGNGTPPPPPSQLMGQDWILAVNTDISDPNSIYMVNPQIKSNSDLHPLSITSISNRPAITDTSGIILFIDSDHNLRALYADTANPQEVIIDSSGIWGSVAIGPGLGSIALTTNFIDTSIYYLDLVNENVIQFIIKTPSYDGPAAGTALYADEMSFDPTGQFILFDTYNEISNNIGSKISFWNINLLDVNSGQMINVFPSLAPGESVGNPSFSKTSYTRFTFDYIDDSTQSDYVFTMDFNSGNIGIVAGPLDVIGYPTYSKDDRTIAYHSLELYQSSLYDAIKKMPLENDMLNGTGNSESFIVGATYPVWFVIGSRLTGIDEKEAIALYTNLEQNYPNPFNPSTRISYQIPKGGIVTLKVYDILGREISTLVNQYQNAGKYSSIFNADKLASGIYIYRLKINNYIFSKKMILLK